MDDTALFALGTMTNSSPAMFERRRRILREARRMIGEGQMDDFNIRELCRRAEVSSRTIYNAFGGKEAVIALAIKDYFEAFHHSMPFAESEATFAGAMERAMAATLRNLQIPNYLHAVTALYFSPTLDPQTREVLIGIGRRPWLAWLWQIRSRRQLERGIDAESIASDLSDLQFAKVHQWGIGVLSDADMVKATAVSVLTHLAGATRGEARAAIREQLDWVARDSAEWCAFVAAIRARIDEHWVNPGGKPPG